MTVLSYLDVDQCKTEPMTKKQSELFINCTFAEKVKPDDLFTEEIANELKEVGQIFYHRLKIADTQVATPAAIFVLCLAGGLPGNIVMWAYTLNRLYKKLNKPVTMHDIAEAFPWGFPTEEQQLEIWDAQKCRLHENSMPDPGFRSDNMVDQMATWE